MSKTKRLEKNNVALISFLVIASLVAIPKPVIFAIPSNQEVFPGADESTPSLAQYFSWINNTNEGSTEEQTLINLDFFQWLHDEYGMVLDIYAFDAGNIDGPRYYGSMDTEKFKDQFPNGFDPIYKKAKQMGTRLGIWLGPDGFGDTPEQEQARIDMLVKLCRDYEFMLFKMDAVCTQLRTEKQGAFARLLTECRKYSPDLILLNHRLNLGPAEKYATTFLWGGAETYIDVHMANRTTGTHNRVQALSRGLVPELKRLTEDHGVCISSCVDFWDDDLILQAFNRSLILAPEIYANPWFLRDDEYPKLARIYNLHRRFGDILVNGIVLPAEQYGPNAVSRGDDTRRFITLRNLTWEPVTYRIDLDESIGLEKGTAVAALYQLHPTEKLLGKKSLSNKSIEVEVLPFRSCLLFATTEPNPEIVVKGCDFEVIRDTPGKDVLLNIMGYPGTRTKISLENEDTTFSHARIEGRPVNDLLKGKSVDISFDGEKIEMPWHRKLGDLAECPIPEDAETLYEATCFAADSDPLEFRSLRRAGSTKIPQVRKARQAFVDQWMMKQRGIDPSYLFDGDPDTYYTFKVNRRHKPQANIRIDFGESIAIDVLKILIENGDVAKKDSKAKGISPVTMPETLTAEVSADLISWDPVPVEATESAVTIKIPPTKSIRYLRTNAVPLRAKDIKGYFKSKELSRNDWRHSYLFDRMANRPAVKAYSLKFSLPEYVDGSYICIPLEGNHGVEGAYAALKYVFSEPEKDTDEDGNSIQKSNETARYIGAPRRAVSYPSNVWEAGCRRSDKNYTYFIPVTHHMIGKQLEVVVLALDKDNLDFQPSAWITCNPIPMVKKQLVLSRGSSKADTTPSASLKTSQPARFDPVIKDIEGWTVYVDPQLLKGENSGPGAEALKMLANHLQRISILLSREKLAKMRKLPIWIEHHHSLGNMQYHPDVGWLISHGYDPRLAKKVHIPRAENLLDRRQMLKHPAVILHELAHAYHDQCLGFDDPAIIEVYDKAMAAGIYEDVLLYNGQRVRHYGATNHKEYFAEGTEAYFYRNDFYPFVAAELKEYDPALYDLLAEIWGPLR